jgi:transcriptional regulator with XRE-family HTH domain
MVRYKNGLKIRAAREKKGLTLAQLAEKVGKTAPYLSDIEHGNRRGTYATLVKIAQVLEMPVEEIWEVA